MSRILCTGGAGFVGSNLAFHLSKKHTVTVMDNLVRRGSEINIPLFKERNIEFIHGDIRNVEDFNHLKGSYDFILETAAQPAACTGYDNPTFDITNNYLGLLNVLEYARKTNARMIFWSTNKVYNGTYVNNAEKIEKPTRYTTEYLIDEYFSIDGNNHSIYGLSKVCADLTCQEWAKAFDMPIIINRFSCLAGPGQFGKSEQGWVAWFVIAAMFNLPVTLYGFKGKQVRDVLFMPDICRLIDIEMSNIDKYRGEVFNIGGGTFCNTSLLECINLIDEMVVEGGWGNKIKWSYDPNVRKADQCVYISDINKAKRLLKWEPKINMEDGLCEIIDWVGKNKEKLKELYAK